MSDDPGAVVVSDDPGAVVVSDDPGLGLVDAWPKRCGCGRSYTEHEWRLLQFVGEMIDDVESCELRNCASCKSTIAMPIDIGTAPTSRPPPLK